MNKCFLLAVLISLLCIGAERNFAYPFELNIEACDSKQASVTTFQQNKVSQVEDTPDPLKRTKYRCPPCGCSNDHLMFIDEGSCSICGMPLVIENYGIARNIDEAVAPFLKSGMLGKVYTKLIYPVFAVGILLSFFLLISSVTGRSLNIFLIGLILVISLYGFKNQLYGVNYGLTSTYKSLFTPISIILLIGPLIFFYVKSLLSSSFKWETRYWLHFVPAILIFLSYTLLLLMSEQVQQHYMFSPFEVLFSHIEQILTVILGCAYLISALGLFNNWKASHAVRNTWLTGWLTRFLMGMGAMLAFWSVMIFINYWLYDFGVATLTYNPLWVFMAVVLMWLAIEVISNPKFFLVNKQTNLANGNQIMTAAELFQHQSDLENLMNDQKLYTDPNLNLDKLAEAMDINPRFLSMILNNAIRKNFYDFINYYRIEEVKHLLKDPDYSKLTIEAIANQAGFKSKSSFNSAFKKHTNMTPREFMKNS